MPPQIELCTCGHAHFGGAHCWCGCPVFDAGEVDDEYPVGERPEVSGLPQRWAGRVLPMHIPTIAYKSAEMTDARAFREAADKLDGGYPMGGGCVKLAVSGLMRAAADALDAAGQPDPPSSYYGRRPAVEQ